MIGDEGALGRRRTRKVGELMHPLGTPVSLPKRPAAPAQEDIASHGQLWEAISDVRDRLANLEGKMSVVLGLAAATFLAVMGLVLARAFG